MIRDQLKTWERDFLIKNGRKPTPKDAKDEPDIYKLYKQYAILKKQAKQSANEFESSTPNEAGRLDLANENNDIDEKKEENIQDTPQKPKITEVFPTPQLHGRVLGLFDIKLPSTPQKNDPQTPSKHIITETPTSQRTPAYLNQRVTLFPEQESPLIPKRASKSISQLIQENENRHTQLSDSDSDTDPELDAILRTDSPAEIDSLDFLPTEADPDEMPMTVPNNAARPRRRGKGSRPKSKKVVLRPILETDVLSKKKATDNYKRLNIQKKKPFGRR